MAQGRAIARVRRQYNQWVADETLEDYALRFTARRARRWSHARVANTALGSISFLALEAIGGAITVSYGFDNAVLAILVVAVLIFATSLPISYYAAKYGVDIDLLTRGAGFGYIGSTVTSLIYASFTFIFFALEAAIMSFALELCFGIPLEVGYLLNALVVIPLVTHGITKISRFQLWTQPLWVILHILPFAFLLIAGGLQPERWMAFQGRFQSSAGPDLLLFGAAASVALSLMAQIGEQVDFLRFLPRDRRGADRRAWWTALIFAGPGWIVLGTLKMLAGSYLAVMLIERGVAPGMAIEPTHMYLESFGRVVASPEGALALTGLFVIVSQLKINVTNAYAGSIAWSNFFARLTHSHPGRVVWLAFNVTIALLLMEFGVFHALEQTLGLYANVAVAWIGALTADLVVNKPLRLSPRHIEFKRAHLYDINPVGVGAMLIASTLSIAAYTGLFGGLARAFAPFIALAAAFVSAVAIAIATKGRYYLARPPETWQPAEAGAAESIRCCICEHDFEPEDMTRCPVYAGPICSLCCSLDARCFDACKSRSRLAEQAADIVDWLLPAALARTLKSRLGHFAVLMLLMGGAIGVALLLVFHQAALADPALRALVAKAFWATFGILMIMAGVVVWLFVLADESRRVAQEESTRQTNLLLREIRAHERTDAELQRAKESAEAANLAKSRYVVGISHELRTPLNAMLGYAQLLDGDPAVPQRRREAVRIIRRSGEHLAGLIEGLLDISKIEAGRLDLNRDEVSLPDFLNQLVSIFRVQAEAKGLSFRVIVDGRLPRVVRTDEKRLRQILVNLLSNAVKCTERGSVSLHISFRSEVAHFVVEDTGWGIEAENLERIFMPFERIEAPGRQPTSGTGLGLTITKLLIEILGGEITVASEIDKGSRFSVRIMLPSSSTSVVDANVIRRVYGYRGRRRTILVVDDNPDHLRLIEDTLAPLGFILHFAENAETALAVAAEATPDLFLLDVSMPGTDGWALAQRLRTEIDAQAPIVMVSANAADEKRRGPSGLHHDEFIAKPINLQDLLTRIERLLKLEWIHVPEGARESGPQGASLSRAEIVRLRELAQLGYVRGLNEALEEIGNSKPEIADQLLKMSALIRTFDLPRLQTVLEELENEPAG